MSDDPMSHSARPTLLFDVNETLSDLRGLRDTATELGAPDRLADTWFASVLRDGFAQSVGGRCADFAQLGREILTGLLAEPLAPQGIPAAVETFMAAFGQLPMHPDVAPGLRALHAAGLPLATLSNGGTAFADALLARAGVRELVDPVLSVHGAGVWKPLPEAYRYGARACGREPDEVMLVAVHPWDVDAAMRAGLRGAWIDRRGGAYPTGFTAPDVTARDLVELADRLSS